MRLARPALVAAVAFSVLSPAVAFSVLSPAVARADFFAAVNVASPDRTNLDVAITNASLGGGVALPAGTNTAANELHPDITPDGKRLTFERVDPVAGTTRVIVVDLSTNQTADVFTGFETATRKPTDPSITADGEFVATGGPFSSGFAAVTLTNLANFPAGPFSHSLVALASRSSDGSTINPDIAGDPKLSGTKYVASARSGGTRAELIFGSPSQSSALARTGTTFPRGALAATDSGFMLIETAPFLFGASGQHDISVTTSATGVASPTPLPPIVNTSRDESQPALSADGRYVAFVRRVLVEPGPTARDRLFVWDSQTQTLLRTSGVDLGPLSTRDVGNVGLYQKPVIVSSTVKRSGTVSAQLAQPSGVGILVQRIIGKKTKEILGQPYKLRTVGRVPLGKFPKGRLRTRWDLKVNRKRLRPGRYLVTPRAVGPRKVVRELGKPRVIKVKKRKRRR
jgi:hypothetical protein